jgi:peptidoglycan pentaglycine glycine transferase (the first glycine)
MSDPDSEWMRRATAWDQFLESSRPDIGFMQSSWWAEFMAQRGWGHFGEVYRDNEEVLGGARVLTWSFAPGKSFYYIPDGPVLPKDGDDARQLFEAILEDIEQKRQDDPDLISHLRLEPRWTHRPSFVTGCREAGSWLEPRDTLHIDLSLAEDALLAQMKPKGRYNIGLARRNGVSVIEDRSPGGLSDFQKIMDETVSRQGLRGKPAGFFKDLIDILSEADRGSLFFAEHQSQRLAAALVIFFGDRATYFYGGSLTDRRNVMAPYLLHFEIMLKAKTRGHKWYDFYGIAPADKPDHRWAKISAFKRKFGGSEMAFGPALDFIFDDSSYQEYRRSRSK